MGKKRKDSPRPANPGKQNSGSLAKQVAPRPKRRRDLRPFIYGGFDLAFAVLYIVIILDLSPNRHGWAQALMLFVPACAILLGLGTIAGSLLRSGRWGRIGWIVSVAAGTGMVLLVIVVIGLLLASAAFLSGVYDAFGKAAASGILGGAALTIELVGLLPVFQLKYLMTRAGRRAFGLQPLWDGPIAAAERA